MSHHPQEEPAAPAKNRMKPQNGAKDVSPGQGGPGRGNAALGKDELAGPAEEEPKDALLLENEKSRLGKIILKKVHAFEKATERINKSLLEGKTYREIQHLGELIKAHFPKLRKGMTAITVTDWSKDNAEVTIPLDPKIPPKDLLDSLFAKSHKLKRSVTALESHLKSLTDEQLKWQKALNELAAIQSVEELTSLKKSLGLENKEQVIKKKRPAAALPYHSFHSESGFEILIGKSSTSNHLLTFQVAHGSDIWMHAHSVSGAHVIIKRKDGVQVDQEALHDALQLALYFSKARSQALTGHEVLVTEKKYVSRTNTAPKGKVMVSKHKIATVYLDEIRIEKIKKRSRK